MSVLSLTLVVHSSSFSDRLIIRCILQFSCGTAAMQEIFSFSPNICNVSASWRRMKKLSWILRCISPRINLTIYGVHAEAWGPLEMEVSSVRLDRGSPVWTRMPSST